MNLLTRLDHWREEFGGDRMLIVTGLLVALFVVIAARDITKPFYGINSYAAAHAAWCARAHLNYGIGYTHGFCTYAVGNPPPANPERYLDVPPLPGLIDAVSMAIFGVNEWALRLTALLVYASCLPFLLNLFRRLLGEDTAILSVLLYVLFPITGYFYSTGWDCWNMPLILAVWWNYLAFTGALRGIPAGQRRHLWMLGGALFVLVQLSWIGAFYAAAVGIHYVVRCLRLRRLPERAPFLVLLLCPAAGLVIDFLVLLSADAWDYYRWIGLFEYRSTVSGAAPDRTPSRWFLQQWEHLQSNFTLPILALVLLYLGSVVTSRLGWLCRRVTSIAPRRENSRTFPCASVFILPELLFMAVITESFWNHHQAYIPLSFSIAIMSALAILRARDALMVRGRRLFADLAVLGILALVVGFCARGLNLYYSTPFYPPDFLKMFERLKGEIPPDQALLSDFSQVYYERPPYKPGCLLPMIAWSLDQQIIVETSLAEVDRLASEGKYSFYLANTWASPQPMIEELKSRYPYEFFNGSEFHHSDRYLFDLRHPLERTSP